MGKVEMFKNAWQFTKIIFITLLFSAHASEQKIAETPVVEPLKELCDYLQLSLRRYPGWKLKLCDGIQWKHKHTSVKGRPLIYAEFGNADSENKMLVFSMVHPDEVTPFYLGFKLVHWLKEHESEFKDAHVIIAPMVNPDSYIRRPPLRVNARGVDLNRNLSTKDWETLALKTWKQKYKSDPRRYPGPKADSEPETEFQKAMLAEFKPKKILSIHAPLNVADYDGPSTMNVDRFSKKYVEECLKFKDKANAKSTGFFTGSLGNYAGQERGVPTITLELSSADYKKADYFWNKFQPYIHQMIEYKIESQ